MKHWPPVNMEKRKARSPDRGSLLLQEPLSMNERAILFLMEVLNGFEEPPRSDWPRHEAEEVSFSRWAVEELLQTGSPLVFVGDGINDAPVLARADVGVAMGALGSDAAIEAADIVLMDDAPSKLALAVRLSRRTMKIVWQNVIFALAVKALVLVLGATGDANMWIAVFADVGVLVLAILNAMRALLVPKH